MRYSTPNTILTKLLTWEYGNRDALFSRQKSGKVSHLVSYGTHARFRSMYTVCIDMLSLWWAKALQGVKHAGACRIYGETNVTWWHGSRQSHRDNCAHNIVWIYTYGNCLKCIPTLQGQELSWLERVAHVAMGVYHKKCTITHTHVGIYIYIYIYIHTYIHHAQCIHTEQESKSDIANVLRVWPHKVQEI